MYWIVWIGIVILSLVIQTVWGNILSICGIKPDLLLIIIIFFAFKHSSFDSGIMGFIAGILQDSLSGTALGINGFTKLIIGLIVNSIKKVYAEKLISIFISVFVFTLIHYLLIFALHSVFLTPLGISTMNKIIFIALYNTIISILIFPIIRKVKGGGE